MVNAKLSIVLDIARNFVTTNGEQFGLCFSLIADYAKMSVCSHERCFSLNPLFTFIFKCIEIKETFGSGNKILVPLNPFPCYVRFKNIAIFVMVQLSFLKMP